MINIALVSLMREIKYMTKLVKQVGCSYDSMKDKTTGYACQQKTLLDAYTEVLRVYIKYLEGLE